MGQTRNKWSRYSLVFSTVNFLVFLLFAYRYVVVTEAEILLPLFAFGAAIVGLFRAESATSTRTAMLISILGVLLYSMTQLWL